MRGHELDQAALVVAGRRLDDVLGEIVEIDVLERQKLLEAPLVTTRRAYRSYRYR